jgi:hypothetical protein
MNLKQTILDLKAAIAEHRWFDAVRLAAVLLKSGTDLAELVIGTANTEDVTAELDALKVECETVVYPTAQPEAIDPATVVQLVLLVIDLIRKSRNK